MMLGANMGKANGGFDCLTTMASQSTMRTSEPREAVRTISLLLWLCWWLRMSGRHVSKSGFSTSKTKFEYLHPFQKALTLRFRPVFTSTLGAAVSQETGTPHERDGFFSQ